MVKNMEPLQNKQTSFGSHPKTPRKAPEPIPKEKPKPGFFGEKGLSRPELRERLRKDTGKIFGTSRYYSRRKREVFEKKFDFKKYGPYINRKDAKGLIKELQKKRIGAGWEEKKKISDDINYLKKLGDFKS